jgi:hypothetical protein
MQLVVLYQSKHHTIAIMQLVVLYQDKYKMIQHDVHGTIANSQLLVVCYQDVHSIRMCLCLCFLIVTLTRVHNVFGQSMRSVEGKVDIQYYYCTTYSIKYKMIQLHLCYNHDTVFAISRLTTDEEYKEEYHFTVVRSFLSSTTTVQNSPSDPNSLHNNEEDNNNIGSLTIMKKTTTTLVLYI